MLVWEDRHGMFFVAIYPISNSTHMDYTKLENLRNKWKRPLVKERWVEEFTSIVNDYLPPSSSASIIFQLFMREKELEDKVRRLEKELEKCKK